jgi:tricorn protease
MSITRTAPPALLTALLVASLAPAAGPLGYYRQPALSRDVIVFVAEGDLWKVGIKGGAATRLTSHPGDEFLPAISPDGQTLAFVAQYDGPTEVYTMPLSGGRPTRRTFTGGEVTTHTASGEVTFVGWTPDGKVLYSTDVYSGLPGNQLVALDISKEKAAAVPTRVPLSEAAEGCYDESGKTLIFTRLPFQGSHTKRYQGGTAQNLWKFAGDDEAVPLTADYKGTSKRPMWWKGRVYFLSDRDGTMNLWSMKPDGTDLKQHTQHDGWDAASASLADGRVAYQLGADIHLYDIASGEDRLVPITLDSDFDQTRERLIDKPTDYLTAAHLSPDGDRVALTARGRVFVAPHRQGRLVEATRKEGVRYREARFLPDGKSLVALSDESGEVELWTLPANGVGAAEQLTKGAEVLRWEGVPSPDGKWIAHHDKNLRLYLYDVDKKEDKKIDETKAFDGFADLRWSPDSDWLAYVTAGDNLFRRVKLYSVADGSITPVTTDRYDSYSPAWSGDGKWLYLLSDRNLKSVVDDPWGSYQPEPFLDKKTKIYHIPLVPGLRSPFLHADELGDKDDAGKKFDLADVRKRLAEVPVPPGNYGSLAVNDKEMFWLSTPSGDKKSALQGADIAAGDVDVKTLLDDVKAFEMSQDGKKLLVQKGDSFYIIDADVTSGVDLAKKDVNLANWSLTVTPREEWRQMFAEAWRLERDYFYDRKLQGVDWAAVRKKYEPLVDRVASKAELSDLIGQMVSELSALHTFVREGDVRKGEVPFPPSSLGAVLTRDEAAGGYKIEHIYQNDPDEPDQAGPLSKPNVNVKEGDVIEAVNGAATLGATDIGVLLRRKAGQKVLLKVKPAGGGDAREVVVTPCSADDAADLRYHEWEYTRRLAVDEMSKEEIGYVHLKGMGSEDFTDWAKAYYPAFARKGLIIDVRHNVGGNIDPWIIGRLLRKAWFYWSVRAGKAPLWNMQYAFRGHVVVLCDAETSSDGEAFVEGVKRLGLGTVIGTRTWGGEIWLNGDDYLVDKGVATAAEMGVYGPEGAWLIEGHGVDPDVVVDNPPHATFKGEDAQLKAAVAHLQKRIKEKPVEPVEPPPFPNKAFPPKKPGGK